MFLKYAACAVMAIAGVILSAYDGYFSFLDMVGSYLILVGVVGAVVWSGLWDKAIDLYYRMKW